MRERSGSTKHGVWAAGLLLSFVGCSSDDMTTGPQGAAGFPAPAAGTTGLTAGTGAPIGTAGVPSGAAGTGAAGTLGVTSGTSAPPIGGTSATAGTGVAGTAAAGSGAAGTASGAAGGGTATAGTSGAAGGAAGAAGMPAPTGPADYSMKGPYEVMYEQVGEGFEYAIASSDTGDGVAGCSSFAAGFGGDAQSSQDFIKLPAGMKMNMYSLYRPMTLEEGRKYPIVTWGNGTCAHPENYKTLLTHVASHGFFVIAANSRQTGANRVMTKALDWAASVTADSKSPYYQHIDMEKVGGFGHSQGGMATITAASDARVKTVVIFNGGSEARKPFMTISGDRDIPFQTLSSMKSAVNSASSKAAYVWYHKVPERGTYDGHLTLITEPMRVVAPTTAWFKYILEDDAESKNWLSGTSCKLCGQDADFEYGQKGL